VSARRLRAITTLAGATLALSGGLAAQALASPSIGGFSAHPAESNPSEPATRSYFIRHIKAGHTFTAHVVVVNSASKPIELLTYPVDGLTGATSGVVYANRQDSVRQAGRWIHPFERRLTIEADSQTSVAFTAAVPSSATPGDHLAGIAFETAHPASTGGHFSITEVIRDVVGIELIVAGHASPQLKLGAASLQALPGTNFPALDVTLQDAGRRLCKPALDVYLARGAHGQWVSRQLDTILPGDTIDYPFPWPRPLAAGTYRAAVIASHCGRSTTLTAKTSLGGTLARTETSDSTPAAQTRPVAGGTSWILFVAFGIGGIAVGAFISRRSWQNPARG